MKVKFNTEELKRRLSQLAAVVAKKAAQPVYGHIRLFTVEQAVEGQLQPVNAVFITGKDIDASLTVTLPKAEADGAIDVLVPFTKLVELVSAYTQDVVLESDGESTAKLQSGRAKAMLKTHPLADWQDGAERPEAATATLPLEAFKEAISNVEFVVPDSNDGKFTVSVAKIISTPEALDVVSTDGYCLAISKVPGDTGSWNLTLPKPAFELVRKLEGAAENKQVTISESDAGFFFDTATETLIVSRSHGDFPNYSRVIPSGHKVQVTIDKAALLASINRVRPMADAEKPIVTFTLAAGSKELKLTANSVETGSADGLQFRQMGEDVVDVEATGGELEFALDVSVLKPFVERAFGTKTGPIVLQSNGPASIVDFHANEGKYRFLQMPTKQPTAVAPATT